MFDALKPKWKTFFWYVDPAAQVVPEPVACG